jgi:hypothetical protein
LNSNQEYQVSCTELNFQAARNHTRSPLSLSNHLNLKLLAFHNPSILLGIFRSIGYNVGVAVLRFGFLQFGPPRAIGARPPSELRLLFGSAPGAFAVGSLGVSLVDFRSARR